MTDEQRKLFKFKDDIFALIANQLRDDANSLTQSDLQGAVSALVRNVYNAGKSLKSDNGSLSPEQGMAKHSSCKA